MNPNQVIKIPENPTAVKDPAPAENDPRPRAATSTPRRGRPRRVEDAAPATADQANIEATMPGAWDVAEGLPLAVGGSNEE